MRLVVQVLPGRCDWSQETADVLRFQGTTCPGDTRASPLKILKKKEAVSVILWRCTVCGFIHDGENPPEKCPKCGAPAEKFEKLPEEKASLVERSRYSNLLHARLLVLANEMTALAEKGIQDNLDPGCLDVFKKAKAATHIIGQMVKAEIQSHMNKGKWG